MTDISLLPVYNSWVMQGIPGWLSGLAPAFGLGHDPGVPGSPEMHFLNASLAHREETLG